MAQDLANKDHQIAALTAEKYTDAAIQAQRDREAALNEKVYGFIIENDKRLALTEANVKVLQSDVARNDAQVEKLRIHEAEDRVSFANLTNNVQAMANSTNAAISALSNTVGQITKLVIPASAVCPQPMPALNSFQCPDNSCGCSAS